ncbi:hypothetical protein BCR32DRAFT_266945 [Anaeromyces robustus]|uniref:RGS domain-containing protein n=1 Tax=Anaeromyces robustus TaxID=1754192 RepID=A0A1Y1XDM8_9FUNG|nr:hypothetical protein BCR32DRAFT_266945 [Anaeromyces robustus]|eukprot:ORX83474.1 hypothetical protein BCR32DRAFT_266945 [Anaeromyces robustus]
MKKFFKYATDNEIKYYTKINEGKDERIKNNNYEISEKIKYHMFVLPSLKECLENRTHAPFCTYNFNVWLKEVESMDNYLDFLLDLLSHKRLIESYKSVRSFSIENEYNSFRNNSLRNEYSNKSFNQEMYNVLNYRSQNNTFKDSERESNSFLKSNDSLEKSYIEQDISNLNIVSLEDTPSIHSSIRRNVSAKDLLYSAKQIFESYLDNKDKSKNIDVSPAIIKVLKKKIYEDKLWYYELFEDIYQQALYILNIGPYQRFLIKRIKSNVSRKHSLMRFILGLVLFFIIIGYLFILVFYKSSILIRVLFSYIPLFISLHSVSVYIDDFDFLIGFMGKSISGYFDVIDIKDEEIIKFHRWKSKKNLIMTLLLDIIISTIFVFV